MLYLPNDELWVNRFVQVLVPSKREIFARTGQRAVSPSGSFTGDDSVVIGKTPTMSAAEFLKDAEAYEELNSDEVE